MDPFFGRFRLISDKKKFEFVSKGGGVVFLLIALFPVAFCHATEQVLQQVAREIREEVLRGNNDAIGKPLPLASHWNEGMSKDGYTPHYQVAMIRKGHHLLPWFNMPRPGQNTGISYYAPLNKVAELKLPITFISTEWEHLLTSDPAYFNLPPDKNPNVVDLNNKILPKISPFGPVKYWRELGRKWTAGPIMEILQELYPDPPLIIFLSNNEAVKLRWTEIERDKRYIAKYGIGRDDNFKRKIMGDAWIERYRALQEGMREGLTNPHWKDKAIFIGYNAFGSSFFARSTNWMDYSLYTPGRFSPWPLAWDGGGPPYYLHNWDRNTDYWVMSPQIRAMNWVFMQKEIYKLNPKYWFEISVWDGHVAGDPSDKRLYYASLGQIYTPDRYSGMVQFGMWLLRPRVVREFRGSTETVTKTGSYFVSIMNAVDNVYSNPILRKFWRKGKLVVNKSHMHPFQAVVPREYQGRDRWFLIDTNLDPPRPWKYETELPVFALPLVMGRSPNREWLIYSFAPKKYIKKVKISIPNYGAVWIDASPSGAYHHLVEKTGKVIAVK